MVIRIPALTGLAAALALLLGSCGPPPSGAGAAAPTRAVVRVMDFTTTEIFNDPNRVEDALPASPAEVWAALPDVYRGLGIPIGSSSSSQRALGHPGFQARRIDGERASHYVDCGMTFRGIVANVYDVTFTVATRVTETADGAALVTTTLDAWAEPRATNGTPVHCTSENTLEERIVAELAGAVGVTGGG